MDWSSPFGCRAQEHQGTLSEVSSTNQGVWPDTKRRKLQKISSLESQTSINNYKFLGILGKMKTTDKYVSRYRASKKLMVLPPKNHVLHQRIFAMLKLPVLVRSPRGPHPGFILANDALAQTGPRQDPYGYGSKCQAGQD